MDPNAVNPYEQNASAMPPQPVGQVPAYPNTSQLYDPLADNRPKPDWQQAIYNNLAVQQQAPPPADFAGPVAGSMAPAQQFQMPSISPSYDAVPPPQTSAAIPAAPLQPNPYVTQAAPPHATYAAIADTANAPIGDIVLDDSVGDTNHSAKKVILFIVIALAILLVGGGVGMGAYMLGRKSGLTERSAQSNNSGVQNNTDGDERLDDEEDPGQDYPAALEFSLRQASYVEEAITGVVGEQLESSDGFVLLVDKVHRDYTSSGSSGSFGSELIRVDILVGNADETKSSTVKTANFAVADESGDLISAEESQDLYEDSPMSITLSPGMKAKFTIFFKIPIGTANLALVRSQQYRVSGEILTMSAIVILFEGGAASSSILP